MVPERFIGGFSKKNPQGDKCLKKLSREKNRTDPIHLFVFSRNVKKMLPQLMLENMQRELKMEFRNYNCLAAITKLVVALH